VKFQHDALRVLPVVTLVCSLLSAPAQAQLTQQGPKLVGTGAVGDASQGYSVSLSGDGNTAIVGGPGDNDSAGAAWVFTRSGEVWANKARNWWAQVPQAATLCRAGLSRFPVTGIPPSSVGLLTILPAPRGCSLNPCSPGRPESRTVTARVSRRWPASIRGSTLQPPPWGTRMCQRCRVPSWPFAEDRGGGLAAHEYCTTRKLLGRDGHKIYGRVAVKWVVPEPDSGRAKTLLDHGLVAPDLIYAECGGRNVTANDKLIRKSGKVRTDFGRGPFRSRKSRNSSRIQLVSRVGLASLTLTVLSQNVAPGRNVFRLRRAPPPPREPPPR
jgi:hypothetical protein